MPKIFFLFLIFVCSFFCVKAQDFQQLREGVEHAQFVRILDSGEGQATVNAVRLDLNKVRLDVVHARDAALGVETVSSMANRYKAIAAINAGFFRRDSSVFNGDAAGVLVVDNVPYSEPFPNRAALFINNQANVTSIEIKRLNLNYSLFLRKSVLPVAGINRERKGDELIVYTPIFHRTTLTAANGVEVVVGGNNRILKIRNGRGGSRIPANGYVLSASGEMRRKLLRVARRGAFVAAGTRYPDAVTREIFLDSEDIVGGVPQLIKSGQVDSAWRSEKISRSFIETKHPRTAIAKLKDNRALLLTVDGRSPTSSGMSLPELAQLLLEMGAAEAINLDGGGSTTMFLAGKIVNRPSDKNGERPVGDAILVFPRRPQ